MSKVSMVMKINKKCSIRIKKIKRYSKIKKMFQNATCKQVEVRILNKATKGPKKSLKSQCNAKEAIPDKIK